MFKYILKKEFLLIIRDIHALLVLFIMPAVFILIMSLALKNTYSNKIAIKQNIAIQSKNSKEIKHLLKMLNKNSYFNATFVSKDSYKDLIYKDRYDFIIKLDENFKEQIKTNKKNFNIIIFSKPDISIQNYEILKNSIVKIISKLIVTEYLMETKINAKILASLDKKLTHKYIYKNKEFETKPTSTQQSVPAWLVFSMFFILIPISNTFINEKNFGTIDRIRSINIAFPPLLLGKIIPYFIINQVQVLIMILIGLYIVPLCGANKLIINGNYFLIFCLTSAISITAICFALLISNIAKTTEEATTIGGLTNIIFAALGGIMVPKFIMPQFMQEITNYSPMAWGLEGLLELFVRGGTFSDIKYTMTYLISFAIISFIISNILLVKKGTK